jgi:hypothetical protein
MKRCPACNQTYTDDALSFCINDGTVLVRPSTYDPQATLMSPPPSVTGPPPFGYSDAGSAGWSTPSDYTPPGVWNTPAAWPEPQQQQQPLQGMPPGMAQVGGQPQQAIAIASLVFGLLSITFGLITCSGPVLGLIAIGLGIFALVQIKNDPRRFGGKGLAIGGIAVGSLWIVFILFWVLLFIIAALAH